MFGVIAKGPRMLSTPDMLKIAIVTLGPILCHLNMRDRSLEDLFKSLLWWFSGTVWAAMLILIILTQKSSGSFIYFQF